MKMTRKFLFCFPLRMGNIVFGYIVIVISLMIVALHLYELGAFIITRENRNEDKFGNFQKLNSIFGEDKSELVDIVTLIYYLTYIIIGLLLFIFAAIFTCGVYKLNDRAISTFFIYSFFHLLFSIGLMVWEALSAGWVQLGLIAVSDVLLIICLFSVKYMMEAIRIGNVYIRPGDVLHKC